MKKQINGRRYDTKTASFLTLIKWQGNACAVYYKKTGEIFLENLETPEIIVISKKEQKEISNLEKVKERINEINDFTLSKKRQINPFIKESTKGKLDELEELLRLSVSEIVDNAINNEYEEIQRQKQERIKAIEEIKKRLSSLT